MAGPQTLALAVPAYNAAEFLPRLLRSAEGQSRPFDEIWVYDDCSNDSTAEVAKSFGAQVLVGEVNRGCSVGKNALARVIKSDWIHFHDADDELLPNFVELAHNWMSEGRFDVVLFDYEERDDSTGEHVAFSRFDAADAMRDARSYAIRRQINPFCGLYRRDAFLRAGGYDEDPQVLYNEDVAMHIGLAFAGLSFSAESQVAIVNHRRTGSMSSANGLKCAQAQFAVLRKTAQRPGALAYRRELASRLWRVAGVLAAYLDWPTADEAVALASSLAPPSRADGSLPFRAMAWAAPRAAVRFREWRLRHRNPGLRAGYPEGDAT